jgi:hypothetical protein
LLHEVVGLDLRSGRDDRDGGEKSDPKGQTGLEVHEPLLFQIRSRLASPGTVSRCVSKAADVGTSEREPPDFAPAGLFHLAKHGFDR